MQARVAILPILLLVLGLSPVAPALPQAAPLAPGTRTISVSGDGDAKAKPNELVISLAVESKATTGDECTRLQSEKAARVVEALKRKLDGKGEVTTSNFSLMPISESVPIAANAAPTPSGIPWQFSESLQATTDKLESVGTLIDAAMSAGADRVSQTDLVIMPVNVSTGQIDPDPRFASGFTGQALDLVGRAAPLAPEAGSQYTLKRLPSVTFEIHTEAATAGEAVRQGAELSHRVERALKDKLGKTGVVQIANFNVNQANPGNQNQGYMRQFMTPQQQYTTKQSFTAHTNIEVKTNQMDLLGPLLDAGMAAGASQLNQVSFTLSSDAAAREEAIAAASREAQGKAEIVAKSMGVKLGKVLSITSTAQVQPQVIYGGGFGGRQVMSSAAILRQMPALPRDVDFTADVNAVYELR